ncbi:alpha-2-macroglobulin family protein [Sodaliphilus sp.]|uniref:alpha-2-macroglobulin family protein n=1 Tax=Sodaliphilus sp. TaxID=2815818 RepID=UPI00388E1FA1
MSWFSFFSHGAEKAVDFNYPKDVSKNALADLESALKQGNGELTVDALIRYSIAQSGISQDNLGEIIDRIEATIKKEKRPEYKALLYYFEARVFEDYMCHADVREVMDVEGENPSKDYSEWTAAQFEVKIDELYKLAVADRQALEAVKVTDLPNIIKCNGLGATYVPTLYLFLASEVMANSSNTDLKEFYLQSAKANSVPAYLYAVDKYNGSKRNEVYEQYRDNEHCGLLLPDWTSNKEDYAKLKGYLSRFPNGVYAPNVQNTINHMEAKHVNLGYPKHITKGEAAKMKVKYSNVERFTLNVYRIPDKEIGNSSYSYTLNRLDKVQTINLDVEGTIPFEGEKDVEVNGLDYGKYVIVPSYMAEGKEQIDESVNWRDDLTVSDLAIFTVEQSDKQNKVFVVNPATGAPVAGVEVSMDYKYDNIHIKATTDKDGMVVIPGNVERCEIKVVKGNDKYADALSYYRDNFGSGSSNNIDIFTDLAIYRPGEKVKWAIVAYYTSDNSRDLQPNAKFNVKFKDINNKEIATTQITTDEFGRAEGTFDIPTDRLNGSFKIEVSKGDDSRGYAIGYKRINVSEYKTPTFDITYTTQRSAFVALEPVVIEGNAKTYSGLPVAGSEVKVTLCKNEWSWNWRHYMPKVKGTVLMDTTVTTDAQGNFKLEFPASLFPENEGNYRWCRYNYSVEAKCTNAAGETHEASKSFIVGSRRGIEMPDNNTFLNEKVYDIPISYKTTSETEKSVVCTYELINKETKETVKTGNFDTAEPKVDFTAVPSGEYTLKAHILAADKDETNADAQMTLVLWRKTDKQAPVKDCAMWLPKTDIKADNAGKASFLVGTSIPEAHIYMVVASHKGVERSEWLHYTAPGMHTVNVTVPERDEEALNITLYTYYKSKENNESLYVTCEARERRIDMEATSFRDKLVPGTPEHWTFKVTDKQGKPVNAAVMLEMFDKALNTLADNTWRFYPYWSRCYKFSISGQNLTYGTMVSKDWQRSSKNTATIEYPALYMYDQRLFGYLGRANRMYSKAAGGRVMAAPMAMVEESVKSQEAVADNGTFGAASKIRVRGATSAHESEAETEAALDNVAMRMADVKTALWQPMLTTNAQGELVVEFDAPQFNTTWIVQGITWDKELYSSRFNREVLTQKEVMVKASLPRFVRTGDKATLTASVMNATDEPRQAKAMIELFDPRTGNVVATKEFDEQLQPNGTNAVSIDWDVPESLAFVGFRIKAASGKHSDGEQVMVPVLASTQPIIETQPFYIEQNEHNHSVTVPSNARDARVTLEYCDNPTWYCVTALPTIFDDNYKISTHAAHTLFTIDVAQGIAAANPKIKEAVDHWNANPQDSVLVSMLAKNQDLKIGNLLASPWLNESDRQTLRMSRIGDLMDKEKMAVERKKVVDALLENQNADGGWCWFKYPGSESSIYTTHEVLELIGEIKHLGYLPENAELDKAVKRALAWYDKEQVRIYNERKKYGDKSYSGFSDFVYVRTLFKDVAMNKDAKTLFNNALKAMKSDWNKGLSLSGKAYFALTMERNGEHKTAAAITESIRQFSITKPELGTYWDNLQSGWRYFDKVAVTATILQALNEVDHRKDEIDGVRKWMLLMKQTNDWGSSSLAADAVYSILSTGTDWLQPASQVSITVDGKALDIADSEKYLGYVRRTLSCQPGAVININRDGTSPAWGAIYNQFRAEMSETPQVAIDELSISKQYYIYGTDGKLVPATSLKVGDKVQVRTVIKCNRDLDFVTVVDERASCFEPVDQLSGYRYADGTYYYLETKDSKTNAFYTSLMKGTHIISYDVYVTARGKFSAGVASAQCQYAPQIAAHSAGTTLEIEK